MTQPNPSSPSAALARLATKVPEDYDDFLSTLGDRDRQNLERHVTFCYAESTDQHARLWKRLVLALARLAPRAAQTVGQRAVRFYITDGKYRQQIFALEDLRDGQLAVYTADVLKDAVRAKIIRGPVSNEESVETYETGGEPSATLTIERLTAAKTTGAPEYFKHMLGWNRTALKLVVPVDASPSLVHAVEAICALSAAPRASSAAVPVR